MVDGVNGEFEVLIDLNILSEDGIVFMVLIELSFKVLFLVYMFFDGGIDWKIIYVCDISKKLDLIDIIKGIKFLNIVWLFDESGFFYLCYF